jgi:broad specificity phosphatase PhoE
LTQLVLLRHGETGMNRRGRYQGWSDHDLTPRGIQQARTAGRLLEEARIRTRTVWSSDLVRARRTAALAFPGATVRCDARLREIDFGSWDGLTWEEAAAESPGAHHAWSRDPERVAPPGGETLTQVRRRLTEWLREHMENARDEPLVGVTHGGPLRLLVAHLLGFSSEWRQEATFYFNPGAVVLMDIPR